MTMECLSFVLVSYLSVSLIISDFLCVGSGFISFHTQPRFQAHF